MIKQSYLNEKIPVKRKWTHMSITKSVTPLWPYSLHFFFFLANYKPFLFPWGVNLSICAPAYSLVLKEFAPEIISSLPFATIFPFYVRLFPKGEKENWAVLLLQTPLSPVFFALLSSLLKQSSLSDWLMFTACSPLNSLISVLSRDFVTTTPLKLLLIRLSTDPCCVKSND